jgi:predicted DNA-binding protein (UPF0251 family)
VVRQQAAELPNRRRRQERQHVLQIRPRLDAQALAGGREAEEHRRRLAAARRPDRQPVFFWRPASPTTFGPWKNGSSSPPCNADGTPPEQPRRENRSGRNARFAIRGPIPCHHTGQIEISEWAEFHEVAARLPDELRAAFDLLWYQGLSQAEAAALLGVAVRTVKRRWMKARLRVQQELGGSPFDEPGSPG